MSGRYLEGEVRAAAIRQVIEITRQLRVVTEPRLRRELTAEAHSLRRQLGWTSDAEDAPND